jgi:tetratricopeptide (TPR) repeat protein
VFLNLLFFLLLSPDRAREMYRTSLKLDDVRAVELLARAFEEDKTNQDVTYRLGYLYHKMNRTREAVDYYSKTVRLNSCHERALNNLGTIAYQEKKKQEARSYYEKAAKCGKDAVTPLYNLANLESEEGNEEAARSLYERVVRKDPNHARSRHNLGLLYFRRYNQTGSDVDLEAAEKQLKEAVRLSPSDPLTLFNFALVLEAGQKTDEAIRVLKKADSLSSGKTIQPRIREALARLKGKGQ